jgi:hypothetical protein
MTHLTYNSKQLRLAVHLRRGWGGGIFMNVAGLYRLPLLLLCCGHCLSGCVADGHWLVVLLAMLLTGAVLLPLTVLAAM